MTTNNTHEPVRQETEITPSNNPLGQAAAIFVVAFNQQLNNPKLPASFDNMEYKAAMVENDPQYGDHVRIDAMVIKGEEAGALTTRKVIIHSAPGVKTRHTVRYVNFGRDEEVGNYHYGQISQLVQSIISYIRRGDTIAE